MLSSRMVEKLLREKQALESLGLRAPRPATVCQRPEMAGPGISTKNAEKKKERLKFWNSGSPRTHPENSGKIPQKWAYLVSRGYFSGIVGVFSEFRAGEYYFGIFRAGFVLTSDSLPLESLFSPSDSLPSVDSPPTILAAPAL